MKKLNNYLLRFLAIAGIVFLYSCGDDDPVTVGNPTISISSTDFDDTTLEATGQPGDVVTATITISAEGGFNTLRINKTGGEAFTEIVESKTVGEDGPATFTYNFTYTLVAEEVGVTVTFNIEAVDDTADGNRTTETLTVITTSPDARIYTTILLAPPLGDKSAETFFSTNTGLKYTPAAVVASSDPLSADIDFGYYEGSVSGANLASPLSFDTNSNAGISAQTDSWGTLNDITFRETTLTDAEFLELTSFADIDAEYDLGTAPSDPSIVSGLAVGDVIAF